MVRRRTFEEMMRRYVPVLMAIVMVSTVAIVLIPTARAATTVNVSISGYAFSPTPVTIQVGDTVKWTNNDGVSHTVVSDSSVFSSGNIPSGGTYSYTFTAAGTYGYHCSIHTYMTGEVIVQGSGSVPTAPQGLTGSAGDGYVKLSWSAPTSNGGSAITNYKVLRGTTSGAETTIATIGNVTTYNDTSVTNGNTYYYKVAAVTSVGTGASSSEVTGAPVAPIGGGSTTSSFPWSTVIIVIVIVIVVIIIIYAMMARGKAKKQ